MATTERELLVSWIGPVSYGRGMSSARGVLRHFYLLCLKLILFWWVLFVTSISSLAQAQDRLTLKNGFATPKDPSRLEVSVIDEKQARGLFHEFANQLDIPFDYVKDGCYARAHLMAEWAEKKGIHMAKVFAEGDLQAYLDSGEEAFVQWSWHVAPVAFVRDSNGKPKLMVFDPSLFSEPVPLETWKKRLLSQDPSLKEYRPKLDQLYFGSRYQYFTRDMEEYKSSWQKADLEHARVTLSEYRERLQQLHQQMSLPPYRHRGQEGTR